MAKQQGKLEEGMNWLSEMKDDVVGDDNNKTSHAHKGRKGGRSRQKHSRSKSK